MKQQSSDPCECGIMRHDLLTRRTSWSIVREGEGLVISLDLKGGCRFDRIGRARPNLWTFHGADCYRELRMRLKGVLRFSSTPRNGEDGYVVEVLLGCVERLRRNYLRTTSGLMA